MPRTSRGVRAITWVEKYCLYPAGPHRGERVCLSMAERDTVRRLYDGSDGLRGVPVIVGHWRAISP